MTCQQCQKGFNSARRGGSPKKFCSAACRYAHHRDRRRLALHAMAKARERGLKAMQRAQKPAKPTADRIPAHVTAMVRASWRLRERYLRDVKSGKVTPDVT